MTIVILVIMTETTADILAIGEIVETKVDAKRVAAGLRADMISTTVAPLFGSFPCSAFAQNVGLVALTKIKSRYVVAAGGAILVLLGLFPVIGRAVAAVPLPVLGGAGIVLFGTVAASGIRTLSKVSYEDNLNLVIVAVSIAVGPDTHCRTGVLERVPELARHHHALRDQRGRAGCRRAERGFQRDQRTPTPVAIGGRRRTRRTRQPAGAAPVAQAHRSPVRRICSTITTAVNEHEGPSTPTAHTA